MERLSRSDLSAVLGFVQQIQLAPDLGAFGLTVVRGLRRLVPSASVSYNDMDLEGAHITWLSDPPLDTYRFPGCEEILSRYMLENPVIAHFARGPDDRCLQTSDVATRDAFHRTTVYNEFYRRLGIEHQFGLVFRGSGTSSVGIAVNRDRHFTERERSRLTAVRPHLVQGYRNALRATELEGTITALLSGVDEMEAGVVLLDDRRQIQMSTTRARALLTAYFETPRRHPDALPPTVHSWVARDESRYRAKEPALRTPYVADRGDRRLTVRLVGDPSRYLLLLTEHRAGVDPRALGPLGLSARETEVLRWVAEGKRDKEIGVILQMSPRTVQHHLQRIYEKLGVETRSAAVATALRAAAAPR